MLSFESQDRIICLIRLFATLDVVFVSFCRSFSDSGYLSLQFSYLILSKENFFPKDVDFGFEVIIPSYRVIEPQLLNS